MKKPIIYKKLNEVKIGEILIIDEKDFNFNGFEKERRVSGKITVYHFRGVNNPHLIRTFSLEKGLRKIEEVGVGRYKWLS